MPPPLGEGGGVLCIIVTFSGQTHPFLKVVSMRTVIYHGPLGKRCNQKYVFLYLNQSICCGHLKEPSKHSHQAHDVKLVNSQVC